MSVAVAKQYAQALHDVLEPMDAGQAARVIEELSRFRELIDYSPELKSVLLNPSVTISEKQEVIGRLEEPLGLSLTRNFLMVVIGRRRIGFFPEIQEAFEQLVSERAGITRAQVTVASELRQIQRERIESELESLTGRSVLCRYGADETLLGGAVIQIGSTVYDGSIRGQMEDLRRRLTE